MLKVEIIGNLGGDAVLESKNGREYVSFTVAHSEKRTVNGQEQRLTTWTTCFRNGNLGGLLPYLKKGTSVFVRGNLSVNQYQDRAGQWQAGLTCNVDEVHLCGSLSQSNNGAPTNEDAPY